MGPYVAGALLSVPAAVVWFMPAGWWRRIAWVDNHVLYGPQKLIPVLRSIPAATLAAWFVFAVYFPILTALGGNRPGPPRPLELVIPLLTIVPWTATMVAGEPRWIVPPAAREL